MISTLHIRNIGIIDDISIDFNEGFNVLTGETGAGKTLIIGSLLSLAGGRFSKEMIRKGSESSLIEVSIYAPQNELSEDGNIIISREVFLNGRNTCKVNGKLVTVNELKGIMSKIIDIHGQNDNQNLLNSAKHIVYLDNYIGSELKSIKDEYYMCFTKYHEIKTKLKNNYGDEQEKVRQLDLLKYQFNEIEAANLKDGEDLELEEKYSLILNSEKLKENLQIVSENIGKTTIDNIDSSIRCLNKIDGYGNIYKTKLDELRNIYYELQEFSRDISNLYEQSDFDMSERYDIEKRLESIQMLKRKYGNSIKEIIEYKQNIKMQIEELENIDEINNKLKEELNNLETKLQSLSNQMNVLRNKYAKVLANNINKELQDLEMQNASFKINVEKQANFNTNGSDKVEFIIKTNVGEEYKELIKIASGGEMSRIMLAIKTVLADIDDVPILVFDEIDVGISGKAAKAVAEKMKIISKKHQTICITHLATIAAKGNYNYYIYKEVKDEKTKTIVKRLNEEETLYEIARISNGDITDIALQNAKELRKVS